MKKEIISNNFMKPKIEKWDWKKEFKEKFENEIFLAVFIQLEKFISKVRVDAVGKGYRESEIENVLEKINDLPRIEITHKDGSKSLAVLEHSLRLITRPKGQNNYET